MATPDLSVAQPAQPAAAKILKQVVVLSLSPAHLQVVNKAIAAELIFVATTNFDQVRACVMHAQLCTISSVWEVATGHPGIAKGVWGVLGMPCAAAALCFRVVRHAVTASSVRLEDWQAGPEACHYCSDSDHSGAHPLLPIVLQALTARYAILCQSQSLKAPILCQGSSSPCHLLLHTCAVLSCRPCTQRAVMWHTCWRA